MQVYLREEYGITPSKKNKEKVLMNIRYISNKIHILEKLSEKNKEIKDSISYIKKEHKKSGKINVTRLYGTRQTSRVFDKRVLYLFIKQRGFPSLIRLKHYITFQYIISSLFPFYDTKIPIRFV